MTEQMIDSGRAALPGAATASDSDLARIPVAAGEILAATAALTLAGRWDTARQLLASAQASGPGGATARRLALAAAATAVHHDFRTTGPRWAPDALAAAEDCREGCRERRRGPGRDGCRERRRGRRRDADRRSRRDRRPGTRARRTAGTWTS